jgi:hypothetical protein
MNLSFQDTGALSMVIEICDLTPLVEDKDFFLVVLVMVANLEYCCFNLS